MMEQSGDATFATTINCFFLTSRVRVMRGENERVVTATYMKVFLFLLLRVKTEKEIEKERGRERERKSVLLL